MNGESTVSRTKNKDDDLQDYPLVEVPMSARKPTASLMFVLLGFTFFTATMFAGGQVGVAFPFWPDLVVVIVAGNALLGVYVAVLGYIACKSGLNTTLMGRMGFGDVGEPLARSIAGRDADWLVRLGHSDHRGRSFTIVRRC